MLLSRRRKAEKGEAPMEAGTEDRARSLMNSIFATLVAAFAHYAFVRYIYSEPSEMHWQFIQVFGIMGTALWVGAGSALLLMICQRAPFYENIAVAVSIFALFVATFLLCLCLAFFVQKLPLGFALRDATALSIPVMIAVFAAAVANRFMRYVTV